jgi:hypothetical protein
VRTKLGYEATCKNDGGVESTGVIRSLLAARTIAAKMANRMGEPACVVKHYGYDYKQRVLRWFPPTQPVAVLDLGEPFPMYTDVGRPIRL